MGAPSKPFWAIVERELTPEEVAAPRGTKAPQLQRLAQRHHRLARMLAEGRTPSETALICDYTPARLVQLQEDSTFRELVDHYRRQVDEQYLGLHERLSDLAMDATGILNERLAEKPEEFENDELMKLVSLGADRVGHGPSSSVKHDHVVGFAERLEAARQRRRISSPQVIEGEIVDE